MAGISLTATGALAAWLVHSITTPLRKSTQELSKSLAQLLIREEYSPTII
jgi:hypothetical protein